MENELKDKIKKGTTTIGIICKDGIVLAADKRATGGSFIFDKDVEKVVPITDNIAVTTSGVVSDIQLVTKMLRAELALKKIRGGREVTVKEAAHLAANILYNNVRKFSPIMGVVGLLLGGRDEQGFNLFQLGLDGSITESKDFRADGSGLTVAYGVLDTLYKKGCTVQEGMVLAVRAVNAAIQRDTNSGEGVDVYTITNKGVKKEITKLLNTKLS